MSQEFANGKNESWPKCLLIGNNIYRMASYFPDIDQNRKNSKRSESEQNSLFLALIFSILFHLLGLPLLQISSKFLPFLNSDTTTKPFLKVEAISKEQLEALKKMRTVGIKNGKKTDTFSLPSQSAPNSKPSTEPPAMSLGQLAVPAKKITNSEIYKSVEKKAELIRDSQGQETEELPIAKFGKQTRAEAARERAVEKSQIMAQALRNSGAGQEEKAILQAAGMDASFNTPEGIDEDKLNSDEKVYYAFQKRTYISYVNSFLSQYRKMSMNYPQVKKSLMEDPHQMTGKITFDEEGNIQAIQIVRGSNNTYVQQLFEKTLENIAALPNPPKALIRDGKFMIYYQLNIN